MQTFKIGCIGLGLMGRPIAVNLLNAGYQVSVYARRAATLSPLCALGAPAYDSPRALAQHCNVIITNVSDSSDVEAVILGPQGILEGAQPGSLVIDMSTISPSVTRTLAHRLKERGVDMLDAPVSGGTQGAVEGTLSIMVGGDVALFEQALPLLQRIGKNIVHIGAHGAGQVAKACNQLIVAQTMTAIAEAYILAKASGVDPAQVRSALMGGFAGSRILEVHGERMLSGNFTPGFKTRLHQKDLDIVMQQAAALGLNLAATQLSQHYLESVTDGELDSAAIYQAIERAQGI